MMYRFSEELLLDEKTLSEVLEYYDDGIEFEQFKVEMLMGKKK